MARSPLHPHRRPGPHPDRAHDPEPRSDRAPPRAARRIVEQPLPHAEPPCGAARHLFDLLDRLLQNPPLRTVFAAVALYCAWSGLFAALAQSLSDPSGVPALVISGAIQGAMAGLVITGCARGALFGCISGVAFGMIGEVTTGWIGAGKWVGKSLLYGAATGLCSARQGGTFREGFVAGVLADLAITANLGIVLLQIGQWL